MAGQHGGARPGAGTKRKDRSGQAFFDDAEAYLVAVVQGRTEPDAVRVQAARTLIQYEKARQRAPVKSLPPRKLHEKTERDVEKSRFADFERESAKVRARLQSKGGTK